MIKPHFTIGNPPYLYRWFLTPWSSDDHPMKSKHLPNIYLHKIVRSDDPRGLHDHPWRSVSVILWRGYIEHVFAYQPREGYELPPIIQKRRRFLSIVRRKAEEAHRLELYNEKPCWSLFITWRKRRPWGFWGTKQGIIGEKHVPVIGEDRKVDWLTLQNKGPVGRWIHNAVFEAVQKMKG